jgi:hypothetical protein
MKGRRGTTDANTQPDRSANETLNTRQAAAFLGLSPQTLRNYRAMACGPRYYKAQRDDGRGRVFYSVADLEIYRATVWNMHRPPALVPGRSA